MRSGFSRRERAARAACKIIAHCLPACAGGKGEPSRVFGSDQPQGIGENQNRPQPRGRGATEIVVHEEKRVPGKEVTAPRTLSPGPRIGHDGAPDEDHLPAVAHRAGAELMFVAVGEIALVEETDLVEGIRVLTSISVPWGASTSCTSPLASGSAASGRLRAIARAGRRMARYCGQAIPTRGSAVAAATRRRRQSGPGVGVVRANEAIRIVLLLQPASQDHVERAAPALVFVQPNDCCRGIEFHFANAERTPSRNCYRSPSPAREFPGRRELSRWRRTMPAGSNERRTIDCLCLDRR